MGHVRDVGCVLILLFGWAPLSSRNAPETSSVESATRAVVFAAKQDLTARHMSAIWLSVDFTQKVPSLQN